MTIGKLREMIKDLPDDADVSVCDAEGLSVSADFYVRSSWGDGASKSKPELIIHVDVVPY